MRRWIAPGLIALAVAYGAASATRAQTPPAQPPASASSPPQAPPGTIPASLPTSPAAPALAPGATPVAIVPLDKSIPGAALAVSGPMQAMNGRAFLTASGSITAGQNTALVTLPYRGTLRVCASSTVKLAADATVPADQVPGLLIALDHGAVEMSFAASTAREKNADTLLTPHFRILIGGPNATDVSVRLGANGDTCVDNSGVPSDRSSSLGWNSGSDSPYVVVTSVFEGGLYRVQAGQRVMFERGSLSTVDDQEKEPCGCPPPPKAMGNEFPLAQSEGLTAPANAAPVASPAASPQPGASDTFSYSGSEHATKPAGPVTVAPPAAAAEIANETPAPKAASKQNKKNFFKKIGDFFRKVFGAE